MIAYHQMSILLLEVGEEVGEGGEGDQKVKCARKGTMGDFFFFLQRTRV